MVSQRRSRKEDASAWTVADSRSVYGIRHWGAGYFNANEQGHVEVMPRGPEGRSIDLHELVAQLRDSGLDLPLLIRFPDILQDRVRQLTGAFDSNIAELEYGNSYTALYPIKVNQQEAVVENIIATENVSIGLEAGSKPELMAVLALAPKGGTIVCNGYKDREFIHLALIGQKLGHNVFIVIEKESEVRLVIEEAAALGVIPQVGLRVRLSSLASSKWADTGGEKSKFGLSAAQLLRVVDRFRDAGLEDGVRLLHFHMGSQIANLADYQHGFREAIRYFGELRALGLPVDHIDVGGGLGVDYDGTHSRNASSINYDIQRFAMQAVRNNLNLEEDPDAALVAVDEQGLVRAMVASRHAYVPGVMENNQALLGHEPGSTFKPIALAEALRQGNSVMSRFEAPGRIELEEWMTEGEPWKVSNYSDAGEAVVMDMVEATAQSSNTAYAQLMLSLGVEPVDSNGDGVTTAKGADSVATLAERSMEESAETRPSMK